MERFIQDITQITQHPYILLIFMTALAFDFINGFHDAANSIATVVGTRVLRPLPAVAWAAWWNFAAAWVFGVAVANTIAKMVHKQYITEDVIFAGLIGAITWDLITWFFGLPTSSSHALLGGFGGAAMAYAGQLHGVLHFKSFIKTISFIVISPMVGLGLALVLIILLLWALRRAIPAKVDRWFRVVQLGSAAAFSLGHGTNDAQKTMGIIAALLYASPEIWKSQQVDFEAGKIQFPFWIVLVCHLAIGLGTLAGGWRIVKTMGLKIAKLRPYSGACAETAAAVALFTTAKLGIPVSTTHTITGAIVGVGAVQRFSAVSWGVARRVVWAWILTIPMSGMFATLAYGAITAIRHLSGPSTSYPILLAVLIAAVIFACLGAYVANQKGRDVGEGGLLGLLFGPLGVLVTALLPTKPKPAQGLTQPTGKSPARSAARSETPAQ